VNGRIEALGIRILPDHRQPAERYAEVEAADVVILPAFGVPVGELQHLRAKGCVLVDTTCGSVLNVWKNVHRYAREGFTSVIHGKHYHEETRATASQVDTHPGSHYLIVRDMAEARLVCDYVEGRGERAAFLARFADRASPGFDPDQHLAKIGVANQTTMLARESLAIAEEIGRSFERARGAGHRATNFRSFDTICSATQDRQDAVQALLAEPLDLMLVIGGYNSSNTLSLAAICAERVTTYHVEDAMAIDAVRGTVRHKPIGRTDDVETAGWLAAAGPLRIGVTAGASTPNNKIGDAVARIFATRGVDPATIA
jgi:4-hydroxy-3-methylbut-2-enyl diphosphate reductase